MKQRANKRSIRVFVPEARVIAEELYTKFKNLDFRQATLIAVAKNKALKIKMYKEDHCLPHIHIDYVNGKEHVASYALSNGELLAGILPRKHNKAVTQWIKSHRKELVELWNLLQKGSVYEDKVSEIKQRKPYLALRNPNYFLSKSSYSLRK